MKSFYTKVLYTKPFYLKPVQWYPAKTQFNWSESPPRYDCSNCKYSFQQENVLKCKLFKYLTIVTETPLKFDYYIDTESARENEKLCGKAGKYFKPI